jgi:hypothetical protein
MQGTTAKQRSLDLERLLAAEANRRTRPGRPMSAFAESHQEIRAVMEYCKGTVMSSDV